jgi:hypothetical protein
MRRTGGVIASRVSAVGLLAAALMVADAPRSVAQTPAPAQPPPAAQAQSFSAPAGLIYVQVKPDKTTDYEAVMAKYKEALEKSEDANVKQMAAGMKLYKSTDPGPQGNTLYVWVVEPTVTGADYSANAMVKLLAAAFPTEAQAMFAQLKEALAGQQPLNLQPVKLGAQ